MTSREPDACIVQRRGERARRCTCVPYACFADAELDQLNEAERMSEKMKVHPAAALFPMMADSSLLALAEDIKSHGLRHPIVVQEVDGERVLLDGRNRLAACEFADVQPTVTVWRGPDPIAFVVSANKDRRRMTSSQRAIIAQELARLTDQKSAADLMDVSLRQLQRARTIVESGVSALVNSVRAGRVTVNTALEISTLPAGEQERLIAEGDGAVKAYSVELRRQRHARDPRIFARGDRTAKELRDGVVRVRTASTATYTSRANDERQEIVRELSAKGLGVTDIAAATGMTKGAVHHLRRKVVPRRDRGLEAAIGDAQAFAEFWVARSAEPTPRWTQAGDDERNELVAALESCRRAASRMITRLKKEAEKEQIAS